MINKTTFAAVIIAFSAITAASSANAGNFNIVVDFGGPHWGHGHHYDRLSSQEVRWMLRDRGYRHIDFSDTHGSTYELTARRHGKDYYMVVSAWSGQIVERHQI